MAGPGGQQFIALPTALHHGIAFSYLVDISITMPRLCAYYLIQNAMFAIQNYHLRDNNTHKWQTGETKGYPGLTSEKAAKEEDCLYYTIVY